MNIINILGYIGLTLLLIWTITSIYTIITNFNKILKVNFKTREYYTPWTNAYLAIISGTTSLCIIIPTCKMIVDFLFQFFKL